MINETNNKNFGSWKQLSISKDPIIKQFIKYAYTKLGFTGKEWARLRNFKMNRNEQVHADYDNDICLDLIKKNSAISNELKSGLIKVIEICKENEEDDD